MRLKDKYNIELVEHKELYSKATFAINESQEFISSKDLNNRRYVKNISNLKQYINLIEDSITEESSKGFFAKLFFNNQELIDKIDSFKCENAKRFEQIKECSECKCFSCTNDCRMYSCFRCEENTKSSVQYCDNETVAVYIINDKYIELTNDDTGEDVRCKVLSIIQDLEYDKEYIIFEANGEKKVLYYTHGVEGDTYEQIDNVADFNFAVESYEKV